ncbi:unnamed protein product [Polarella glacialis]|uniref:Uncharacterized protein n=2 Tax=Polarella glacialis TaxID=89957 RepID=A0A813I3X0_POLGL|nr:unnamed protein product [Polarella glacialis]
MHCPSQHFYFLDSGTGLNCFVRMSRCWHLAAAILGCCLATVSLRAQSGSASHAASLASGKLLWSGTSQGACQGLGFCVAGLQGPAWGGSSSFWGRDTSRSRSSSLGAANPKSPSGHGKSPSLVADEASADTPSRESKAPEALPNARLEVLVLGGGVAGLCVALLLAANQRGKKRVRVCDSRWQSTEAEGGRRNVTWRSDVTRNTQVVSLQSRIWSQLPSHLQERLVSECSFFEQWPLQRESPGNCGFPKSLALHELEAKLLEIAQEEPFAASIDLQPLGETLADVGDIIESQLFHSLVVADGPDALGARDDVLGNFFGGTLDEGELGCQGALGVAFDFRDLPLPAPGTHCGTALNVAESTVLSLAQRRFILNAASSQHGVMSMMLAEGEVEAADRLVAAGAQPGAEDMGVLWSQVQEGLKLFGVPEAAARGLIRLRPRLQGRQDYFAELKSLSAPEAEASCLPHPFVFLVGDSADIENPWAGRTVNSSVRGALALSQQLSATCQSIMAGYPVDSSFFQKYQQQMDLLQNHEVGMHSRQAQTSSQSSSRTSQNVFSRSLGTCLEVALSGAEGSASSSSSPASSAINGEAAFLEALRRSRSRLVEGSHLPPERLNELPEEAVLCERIRSLKLRPETMQAFHASGCWIIDPPSAEEMETALSRILDQESARQGADSEAPLRKDEETSEADKAEARAEFNMGVRLVKGTGGEAKNEAEAARCFSRAANKDHTEAAYALAVMLLKGQGIKKNEIQASQWFQVASLKGHVKAMYNLSVMYMHGVGVKKDSRLAGEWAVNAAQRGHKKALRSGNVLVFGAGPWMDYEPKTMGAEKILKEAEAGNEHAQFRYATMCYDGDFVPQDRAKASYWFMAAAQTGLAEAQYQMSRMLFLGDGVEKDEDYALRFLGLAAEQGHVESMHNFGVKLYFGEGIGLDRRQAASWFLKAAQKGMPEAQNNVGWMLFCGDGVTENISEGTKWLELAAAAGNMDAQMHLKSVSGSFIS